MGTARDHFRIPRSQRIQDIYWEVVFGEINDCTPISASMRKNVTRGQSGSRYLLLSLSLALLVIFGFRPPQKRLHKVAVNILGLNSSFGEVFVGLYNGEDGYPTQPGKAYRMAFATITLQKCAVVFDSIPPGRYALVCYHDQNGHGKAEPNFFGITVEGTCTSKDDKGFYGPLNFKDAEFPVNSDVTKNITISY